MVERIVHQGELDKKAVLLSNGSTHVSIGVSKKDSDFLEIYCAPNHSLNVTYMVLEQDLENGGWQYVRYIQNPGSNTMFNLKNGGALQINLRNKDTKERCTLVSYRIIYNRGSGFYYTNAELVE